MPKILSIQFEIAEAKVIPIDCATDAKEGHMGLKDAPIHSSVAQPRSVGTLWILHECVLLLR
jgi:hypothetical protein